MDGRSREDGITVGEHNLSVMLKTNYENKVLKHDYRREIKGQDRDTAQDHLADSGRRITDGVGHYSRYLCGCGGGQAECGCYRPAAEHPDHVEGPDPV